MGNGKYGEYQELITFEDGSQADIWLDTEYKFMNKELDSNHLTIGYCNSGPHYYFRIEKLD